MKHQVIIKMFVVLLAVATAGVLIAMHRMVRTPGQQALHAAKPPVADNESSSVAKSPSSPIAPKNLPAVASNLTQTPAVAPVEKPTVPTNQQPQTAQSRTNQSLTYNGYEVQNPAARVALYFVGTGDSEANAYWASAVFDPNLPAEERKDLIEDLNETGMADPQHPSPADLPMILARMRLIQQLAPYSIDQVDADAFGEAYKDLVGMANGQTPQ
jgi:hypothetical protein